MVYTSLAVNLIGQRSPDVIGRLSVSVGLLLVKCLLFVCFVVVVNKSFVWCR